MTKEGGHRPGTRHTRMRAAIAMVATLLLCAAHVRAATVAAAYATTGDGRIAVTVSMKPGSGESVAGAQFSLRLDPSRYEVQEIAIGAAASGAGKEAAAGVRGGEITVIVAGFNQNVIEDGPLATVYFMPLDGGPSPLPEIAGAVLSDPLGKPVPAVIPPSPKTEYPPVDEDSPPSAQTPLTTPQPHSQTPPRNGDTAARSNRHSAFAQPLDEEEDLSGTALGTPYPVSSVRKASIASTGAYPPGTGPAAPSNAGRPGSTGIEPRTLSPAQLAGPRETVQADSSVTGGQSGRVEIARTLAPHTAIGESIYAPSDTAPGGAPDAPFAAMPRHWRQPAVFVLCVALIAGIFPLRRRIFDKGRH